MSEPTCTDCSCDLAEGTLADPDGQTRCDTCQEHRWGLCGEGCPDLGCSGDGDGDARSAV